MNSKRIYVIFVVILAIIAITYMVQSSSQDGLSHYIKTRKNPTLLDWQLLCFNTSGLKFPKDGTTAKYALPYGMHFNYDTEQFYTSITILNVIGHDDTESFKSLPHEKKKQFVENIIRHITLYLPIFFRGVNNMEDHLKVDFVLADEEKTTQTYPTPLFAVYENGKLTFKFANLD